MIKHIKSATCILLLTATVALVGCSSHKVETNAAGGTSPQMQQIIRQDAAKRAADYKNRPAPGTLAPGSPNPGRQNPARNPI